MLDSYQNLTFGEKHLFTDTVFMAYNKNNNLQKVHDHIIAAEPGLFLPLVDPGQMGYIKNLCNIQDKELTPIQKQICKEISSRQYRNSQRDYSYAVHYWEHFVFWDNERKLSDVVSIYDVIPNAKNATQFMWELTHWSNISSYTTIIIWKRFIHFTYASLIFSVVTTINVVFNYYYLLIKWRAGNTTLGLFCNWCICWLLKQSTEWEAVK